MTYNFDDVNDTDLNVNQFLTLLTLYLKNADKEPINYKEFEYDYLILEEKKYIKILREDNNVTYSLRVTGKELIEKIMNFMPVKTKNNSTFEKLFEEFWKLYPSSDKHSIYTRTRALKSNRVGCKNRYIKFIKEGVKHSDIIKALRYEIEDRKKTSGKDNKLSYMKNSFTWLNQREFDIILETIEDVKSDNGDWTSNTI